MRIEDIKSGDLIEIGPLEVSFVRGDYVVVILPTRAEATILLREVTKHTPRPFVVGDHAKTLTGSLVTIIAIHDGQGWCQWDDYHMATVPLADLTRA